jgi:hypothetical protein
VQSRGVQVGALQTPEAAPGAFTHWTPLPAQQSWLSVQDWPTLRHAPAQTYCPGFAGSGTQGSVQQSALVVHAVPGGGCTLQVPMEWRRQRGIFWLSSAQQSSGWLLQWPLSRPAYSQQLSDTLQESEPPTLQVWPGSRQEPPCWPQRPNSSVALDLLQTLGLPP